MPMMNKPKTHASNTRFSPTSFLKRFAQDEDGSVLIMTILLLITMLIMGGMAVDFMRYESRRAEIQGVADRAVLAAANLTPTGVAAEDAVSREEVALDYFKKAGYEHTITDGPNVTAGAGSSSAHVAAEVNVNTFYLRLAGIDQLDAPAVSQAIQGVGKTEVSLVLDISGSMAFSPDYDNPPSSGPTRMSNLQSAAKQFAADVLAANGTAPAAGASAAEINEYQPRVSLSLVSYTGHVSVGDALFKKLNVDTRGATSTFERDEDGNFVTFANPNRCVIFPNSAYYSTAYDKDLPLVQVAHADHYSRASRWGGSDPVNDDNLICPPEDAEQIIVHADQPGPIQTAIGKLTPRFSTSIHLGMKWGVTLLDPSMRSIIEDVPGLHANFASDRPSAYIGKGEDAALKYIVLMTDGDNTEMRDVRNRYYNSYEEQVALTETSLQGLYRDRSYRDDLTEVITSGGTQDTLLQAICEKARDAGVVIYTITMASDDIPTTDEGAFDPDRATRGQQQMHDCASSSSHFYSTQNQDLSAIFKDISEQITDLRLNL